MPIVVRFIDGPRELTRESARRWIRSAGLTIPAGLDNALDAFLQEDRVYGFLQHADFLRAMRSRRIRLRNGRLDNSGLAAYRSREITIQPEEVELALTGWTGTPPAAYEAQPATVQTVPLTSVVLDFDQRQIDYDKTRLKSIISALKSGTPLPPLAVTANENGTYKLENGYHRFLACALIGFPHVPIDQAARAAAPPVVQAQGKWVPRHKRTE